MISSELAFLYETWSNFCNYIVLACLRMKSPRNGIMKILKITVGEVASQKSEEFVGFTSDGRYTDVWSWKDDV